MENNKDYRSLQFDIASYLSITKERYENENSKFGGYCYNNYFANEYNIKCLFAKSNKDT
jgi:hypothetical protein